MDSFYENTLIQAAPRLFTVFLLLLGAGILWGINVFSVYGIGWKKFVTAVMGTGVLLSALSYFCNGGYVMKFFVIHMLMIWGMVTLITALFLANQK